MKLIKNLTAALLAISVLAGPFTALAGEDKAEKLDKPDPKLKPYTLKTCSVSGDKLGEMGDPILYKYKDRELKFCCKDCPKDFDKDPAKFIKKLNEAEAKEAKTKKSGN